jgi:Glycosyl hydrolase family 12
MKFSTLTQLSINAVWNYVPVDPSMICNVALDVFADIDPTAAQNETLAQYEIMVWYGVYGGPWPLGYSDGSKMKQTINGVD